MSQTEEIVYLKTEDIHPYQKNPRHNEKAVPYVANSIREFGFKVPIVVDFFGGSGSTMIAAEQLHRRAYLMELDPRFVDVIIDRWQKMTGKKAKLLNEETNPNRKKK